MHPPARQSRGKRAVFPISQLSLAIKNVRFSSGEEAWPRAAIMRTRIALRVSPSLVDTLIKTVGMWLLFWTLLGLAAEAQTDCASQHASTGVYICYPNPAENPSDAVIPDGFHLSAQGNAPVGKTVSHFRVLLDNHLVYENWAVPPVQKLSIETNLNSPFDSGVHTLQFVVDGVGTAEVKGLKIVRGTNASFCDSFFRADRRTCAAGRRAPLHWSLTESQLHTSDPLNEYLSFLDLFGQNLKALEADASDAVAIDTEGNLYVASHAFSDVEIRKFTPAGSIIYDSLIRSCGNGFLSVAGLAIDKTGRVWIAANTTACFVTTPGVIKKDTSEAKRTRGLVILVDSTKPSALAPIFVTYLADVEYEIAGIRVDGEGNAYLGGTTGSPEYPHESLLDIGNDPDTAPGTPLSFISVLNSSGSGLRWSTLLRNAKLTALALDDTGNVYVTGSVTSVNTTSGAYNQKATSGRPALSCDAQRKPARACDDIMIAKITDDGQKLSYSAWLGGSRDQEGRAISLSAHGDWVFVTGETDSPDFPASGTINLSPGDSQQSVVMAMQPCKTGLSAARFIPESRTVAPIAFGVALDAFTASQRFDPAELAKSMQKPILSIQAVSPCPR
jgi:hypothetical protein